MAGWARISACGSFSLETTVSSTLPGSRAPGQRLIGALPPSSDLHARCTPPAVPVPGREDVPHLAHLPDWRKGVPPPRSPPPLPHELAGVPVLRASVPHISRALPSHVADGTLMSPSSNPISPTLCHTESPRGSRMRLAPVLPRLSPC